MKIRWILSSSTFSHSEAVLGMVGMRSQLVNYEAVFDDTRETGWIFEQYFELTMENKADYYKSIAT